MDVQKIVDIYCFCHDFYTNIDIPLGLPSSRRHTGGRPPKLTIPERMTILILFQHSKYKTLKDFYIKDIEKGYLSSYFLQKPCYSQFTRGIKSTLVHLFMAVGALNQTQSSPREDSQKSEKKKRYYIDSTLLPVCHIKREYRHKTFKGLATKGASSMGFFIGFKLHLVVDTKGNIVSFRLTKGNVADNNQELLRQLLKGLKGKVFGDKGYLSKISQELENQGLKLVTKTRKNMKKTPKRDEEERFYLWKRGYIETIFHLFKNQLMLWHTRHRNPLNWLAHTVSCLVAWQFYDKKPTVDFQEKTKLENYFCTLPI
jgi:hypothetical protein